MNSIFTRLCLLLFLAVGQSFAQEQVIDRIIAVVNDRPITLSALENQLIIENVENPSLEKKWEILEKLVERKLLYQEAERWGIPLARWEDKVQAEIEAIKSKYSSEAAFLQDLKESGLTYEDVSESIKEGLIVQDLIARQFRSKIDPAQIEQEAAQYFEQNRSEFVEPMQIKFQYIMTLTKPGDSTTQEASAKQLAEEISARLQAGAELADVEKMYKSNPLVWVETAPEIRSVTTEIDAAIAELDVNAVSKPLSTPNGYLIAKLLEKKLPLQKTYPQVSQQIKDRLIQEDLNAQIKAWLKEQKAMGDIRILDAALAQLKIAEPVPSVAQD
jgi:parvulin-like peptidyl-prolyl isomerase